MLSGCLYGVGLGPGDPELMTLRAARILRESDLAVAPGPWPPSTPSPARPNVERMPLWRRPRAGRSGADDAQGGAHPARIGSGGSPRAVAAVNAIAREAEC